MGSCHPLGPTNLMGVLEGQHLLDPSPPLGTSPNNQPRPHRNPPGWSRSQPLPLRAVLPPHLAAQRKVEHLAQARPLVREEVAQRQAAAQPAQQAIEAKQAVFMIDKAVMDWYDNLEH